MQPEPKVTPDTLLARLTPCDGCQTPKVSKPTSRPAVFENLSVSIRTKSLSGIGLRSEVDEGWRIPLWEPENLRQDDR
jgi:hypothetical protein